MAQKYFALMELEQIATVIQEAHRSGCLDELNEVGCTAEEIARKHRGKLKPYELLLNVLAALGYASIEGDRYFASKELLDLRKDNSFKWERFSRFLATGEPWIEIDKTLEELDSFYAAFFAGVDYAVQMEAVADAVARRLETRPTRVLDVGAGTGLWSLAMARRVPNMSVTAVDLPQVLANHFQRRAIELGCASRVETLVGDFHSVEFPKEAFDRVVMGSSFHFLREAEAPAYLRKVFNTITQGGEFVVIDHFADATTHQRLSRTLYEMRLAMRTRRAKNYSCKEIETMCRELGLSLVDRFEVDGPGFLSVLVFSKPQAGRRLRVA